MKISRFGTLWEIETEDNIDMNRLSGGQLFLYGSSVINQKYSKEPGDQIVYYKVIKKEGNSIEYMQIFDVLEDG
jgi:hypothetical protein